MKQWICRVGITLMAIPALSAGCTKASAPDVTNLKDAAQSLRQPSDSSEQNEIQNCVGDSPTGTNVYVKFPMSANGTGAENQFNAKMQTNGWKKSENGLFKKTFGGDTIVAALQKSQDTDKFVIVLYLASGAKSCAKK